MAVKYHDLGMLEYKSAWDLQDELHAEIVAAKATPNKIRSQNHLLFCEHPHVFTIGKSGSEKNLLVGPKELEEKKISLFRTSRGGDITYHGPGQIVGYPILDLEQFHIGVREYICRLEDSIILLLRDFGIVGSRMDKAAGVWLDPETRQARKICALGVRTSRYVTMHGFALNVNTDLAYFSYINPCGFTDKAVTSMQKELGMNIEIPTVKRKLRERIAEVFQMKIII